MKRQSYNTILVPHDSSELADSVLPEVLSIVSAFSPKVILVQVVDSLFQINAKLAPTVVIGAKIKEWGTNYRIGKSKFLIVEADEYNNNFMSYQPNLTIVTNIDIDHLEFFKDLEHIEQSFEDFLVKTKETVVANMLDPHVAEVVKWSMKKSSIEVMDFNKIDVNFELEVPGDFNISNAKAAFQIGLLLGIEPSQMIKSLNSFTGIGRRFEKIGEKDEQIYYSDFAHHPREVFVTLEAAREKYPDKKIGLIFQPHLYSRTKLLFDDFVDVLQRAPIDQIIITDIFASRENDPGNIGSPMLVKATDKGTVRYVPTVEEALNRMRSDKSDRSDKIGLDRMGVVILMGAGDIDAKTRKYLKK
jgi:UDP-N-acetylmuramate--alanine ligase